MILVTGGAGFIGSNFVFRWCASMREPVVNLDALTYAGNLQNLKPLKDSPQHVFVCGSIADAPLVSGLLSLHRPRAVINFAAESHVDRSIDGPEAFVQTNVVGTYRLLEAVRAYWASMSSREQSLFRFLHVSTDEVYGSLAVDEAASSETTPYAPNSPYAATKAASDHLVRAYHQTYGLPTITTHCSNNYGPLQFPEKLIPLMIVNCLAGKSLPVYGNGRQIRDWLFVEDHCAALCSLLESGLVGETYNVGGQSEKENIEVVNAVCALLDQMAPAIERDIQNAKTGYPLERYADLITFVKDRPGHDRRYAIDARKIERDLGWKPAETFETGLRKTVRWYLHNQDWIASVTSGQSRQWIDHQRCHASE